MSFYARRAEAPMAPFFSFVRDLEQHFPQHPLTAAPRCRTVAFRSFEPKWLPKFDFRESSDAYELNGELPGVSKDNVKIEFTEQQTLTIQGKTERNYATTNSAPTTQNEKVDAVITEAASHEADDGTTAGTAPGTPTTTASTHQATVEDGDEDFDGPESTFEEIENPNETTEHQIQPAKQETEASHSQQQVQPAAKPVRFWLAERSIGSFSRSFNFPSRIDQDNVTASFEDGILSLRIPKAKKYESRRITIK